MPAPVGKAGDIRVWLVSGLFFLILITGGTFLVLYVAFPANAVPGWFPIAGIVLVAVPWFFWFLTCVYRCFLFGGGEERQPIRASSVTPIVGGGRPAVITAQAVDNDLAVESLGGARRVWFGNATVMGSPDAACSSEGPAAAAEAAEQRNGAVHSDDGSSHSEVPLSLSMS